MLRAIPCDRSLMRRRGARRWWAVTALLLAWPSVLLSQRPARAHIGSPDVVLGGQAGPYALLITVRPPAVIPGVALVEVLAPDDRLSRVTMVAAPGSGAVMPATAEGIRPAADDPHRFSGPLQLTAPGPWQARVHVEGPRGAGEIAVAVPALARQMSKLQRALGVGLTALLALLVAGLITLAGSGVRRAGLDTGDRPDPRRHRRIRRRHLAPALAAALLLAVVGSGVMWWSDAAAFYARRLFKPLELAAQVQTDSAGAAQLVLTLNDPGWAKARRLDDLVPDHDHLMHLFAVRVPALDVVAHLHPDQRAPGRFTRALPALPAGTYQLFADVVHQDGLAETATTTLTLTQPRSGGLPRDDDAVGVGPAMSAAGVVGAGPRVAVLPDGTRVVWLRAANERLRAGRVSWLRFQVQDGQGKPAADVRPYMGMAGHAMFIKDDGSVFAHIHPTGSVSMATLSLIAGDGQAGAADPHAAHRAAAAATALPPEIAFPYACPTPGRYRVVVQFKRGETIETAFFAAPVD